jgi:hypothetical protein
VQGLTDDLTASDLLTTSSTLAHPPALSISNSSVGVTRVEATVISATDAVNNESELHQDFAAGKPSIPNSDQDYLWLSPK